MNKFMKIIIGLGAVFFIVYLVLLASFFNILGSF